MTFLLITTPEFTKPGNCSRECDITHVEDESDIDDVEFFPLPDSLEGRIPVPFTYKFDSAAKRDAALFIHASTGNFAPENEFYSVIVQRRSLSITKTDPKSGHSEELAAGKTNLKPGSKTDNPRSFFLRLKVRDEYIQIGLYGTGGETGVEPLITYKDESPFKSELTHYAFSTDGGDARIWHRCVSGLDDQCLHAVECLDVKGATCVSRDDDDYAECDCDDDYVRTGSTCEANPTGLGDPCIDSRQCSKLKAYCRPVKTDGGKTCQCPPGDFYFSKSQGICSPVKDQADLPFHRLNRLPTWREISPGRVTPEPAPAPGTVLARSRQALNDGTYKVRAHCVIALALKGYKDYPLPAFPRQFFPLALDKKGFEFGFFVKGTGELLVQFTRHGNIDEDNELFLEMLLEKRRISVRKVDDDKSSVKELEASAVKKDHMTGYWMSLECGLFNCTFNAGQVGDNDNAVHLEFSPNPWFSKDAAPTHVAFLPGSIEAELRVLAQCTASHGERCSHTSDCQKSHVDLVCSRRQNQGAKCECRSGVPNWNSLENKCQQ